MNAELLILSNNGISCKKYKQAKQQMKKDQSLNSFVMTNSSAINIFGKDKIEDLKTQLHPDFVEKYTQEMKDLHISFITCEDSAYPISLKCAEDYPLVIYYSGDISLLSKTMITIVGSRTPTQYGQMMAEKFTKELALAGLVTISGLAYGIDSIVAKTTLENKGKTIAFLAGGLKKIYPEEHVPLARKIVKSGGLVMSTYPPYKSALKFSFLERNKIMSLLSKGTLIIEAGLKSGTISTANYTIENGRELFVLPGHVNSSKSEGSNSLIEQFPETFTVSSSKILSKLGINYELKKGDNNTVALDEDELLILGAIIDEEKSLEEIADITKLEIKIVNIKLTTMEINGLIKKLPGNFYIGIK